MPRVLCGAQPVLLLLALQQAAQLCGIRDVRRAAQQQAAGLEWCEHLRQRGMHGWLRRVAIHGRVMPFHPDRAALSIWCATTTAHASWAHLEQSQAEVHAGCCLLVRQSCQAVGGVECRQVVLRGEDAARAARGKGRVRGSAPATQPTQSCSHHGRMRKAVL